jgi:hypothetical protein
MTKKWLGLAARNLAAVAVLGMLAVPTADAQEWQPGTIEQSTVSNCNLDPETGIMANAEFQSDPAKVPNVDDVFYVRTIPGRVGNGCGSGMSVHVEIVLPAGVELAISPSTPVHCNYMDIDTAALTPAPGCPQAPQDGVYGVAFDQLAGASPSPWSLAYGQALVIEIPLRSSRGLAGRAPTCVRYAGDPPCSSGSAGDSLQFADKVIDGFGSPWLSPWVGLFVDPSGAGSPTGSAPVASAPAPVGKGQGTLGALISAAPSAVRVGRLLRGLPIRVSVGEAGSTVTAKLSAKRSPRIIARATVTRAQGGTVALTVKPSRPAVRSLRRLRRPLKATLQVRVVTPGGGSRTAIKTVVIRP